MAGDSVQKIGFGQVNVDQKTGRVQVGQTIMGIDTSKMIEAAGAKSQFMAKSVQKDIDADTKVLDFLGQYQTVLQSLKNAGAALGTRFNDRTCPNVFQDLAADLSCTNPAYNPAAFLDITVNPSAPPGSSTLQINQLATNDLVKGRLTNPAIPDVLTAAGLNGTLTLGTIDPSTTQTITITPAMSLKNIVDSINNTTYANNTIAGTDVTAEVIQVANGVPPTFQMKLKCINTGRPIILSDTGGLLTGLGITPSVSAPNLCGKVATLTDTTALSMTGNLTIAQSVSGITNTLALNAGMTLQDVITAINSDPTLSAIVVADSDLMVAGSMGPPPTDGQYQLRVRSLDPTKDITVTGDPGPVNGLGLDRPITDYNGLVAQVILDGELIKKPGNTPSLITGTFITLNAVTPVGASILIEIAPDKTTVEKALLNWMKAFNDVVKFVNEQQTLTSEQMQNFESNFEKLDLPPLFNNSVMSDTYYQISSQLGLKVPGITATPGTSMVTPQCLLDMGLIIDNNGFIDINPGAANEDTGANGQTQLNLCLENLQGLQALLGHTATSTDPDFHLAAITSTLDPTLAGQNIQFTVDNSTPPMSAKFTYGGIDYPATITGSTFTATINPSGKAPLTLSVYYTGTNLTAFSPPITTTMTFKQGIIASQDIALTNMLKAPTGNVVSQYGVDFNLYGELTAEIARITVDKLTKGSNLERITADGQAAVEQVRKSYESVYKSAMAYDNMSRMLSSWLASMNSK